ncbi:MAG: hypothetical protein ACI96N_003378 [Arenicella sp.]|jgi:hypothetical protein
MQTYWFDDKGRSDVQLNITASTDLNQRGGATCSSDEASAMGVERRGCVILLSFIVNQQWEEQ